MISSFTVLFALIFLGVNLHIDNDGHQTDDIEDVKEDSSFEIIAQRFEASIWDSDYRYYEMDLNEEPISDEEGYYLASIDYTEDRSSYWQAIRHLEYTMAYIKKMGKEEIAQNEDVQKKILGLIDYWLENDYNNNSNWYYNQIGVPYDLADISIMMRDYLDEERIKKISEILNRGTFGRGVDASYVTSSSNDTDFLNISIENAILTQDKVLMKDCFEIVNNLIVIDTQKDTGIQADLSYLGHTLLCCGGAYGATYTDNISWLCT